LRLTEHFSLDELIKSDVGLRNGVDNTPSKNVVKNLELVSDNILEPVRNHFNIPFVPSSGYRCISINRLIGSNDNSQHVKGEAVDFEVPGIDNYDAAMWIFKNLKFDQLILECYQPGKPNSGWVHCSYVSDNPRGEVLTYTNNRYIEGLIS
jgi:Peptidase M15